MTVSTKKQRRRVEHEVMTGSLRVVISVTPHVGVSCKTFHSGRKPGYYGFKGDFCVSPHLSKKIPLESGPCFTHRKAARRAFAKQVKAEVAKLAQERF